MSIDQGRLPEHNASLHLTHNQHKSYYETVEQAIQSGTYREEYWVSQAQKEKAIATDCVWEMQWYPNTPVSFSLRIACDLDALFEAETVSAVATPSPADLSRLRYDLRLQIGKALDRLVCDDSSPEQVDKFIETFSEFGLTIRYAHAVKDQLEEGVSLSGSGRLASSASSVTPLRNNAKSWLATIWPSALSGRMLSIRQRASIARLSFSKSSESRKSNMFSLPSESTSSEKYRELFSSSQELAEGKIAPAVAQAPAPKLEGTDSSHSVDPASLLQDHGCKFSSSHSSGFGDAEFTDESDKPVAVGELNGEVSGFDHGGSPLPAETSTDVTGNPLTKLSLPIELVGRNRSIEPARSSKERGYE